MSTWRPSLCVVVSGTTLGNAAAAARGELGRQLVFVVAIATRQGPGMMRVRVAAAAAGRGFARQPRYVLCRVANLLQSNTERTFHSGVGVG